MTEQQIQELYEIADGALGDGPMSRGNAVRALREAGLDYPDTRTAEQIEAHAVTVKDGSAAS